MLGLGGNKKKKQQRPPINSQEAKAMQRENKAVQDFAKGLIDVKDVIAPSALEVNIFELILS